MQLSGLWIYPIKSARGIALEQSKITDRGLMYDRRWMLVNTEGRFLTQRELPQMAKLGIEITETGLRCSFGDSQCDVPFLETSGVDASVAPKKVTVWRSTVLAQGYPQAINAWFSLHLKADCELVYMPEHAIRQTNPVYAVDGQVSFADGYPFLITTTASLQALNKALLNKGCDVVTMQRFRPNLVIENEIPFEEENWKQLKIGHVTFEVVKPCERCVIINTHQQTGKRYQEPLKTLAQYRRQLKLSEEKVVFGQNALCTSAFETLKQNMPVTLLSKKSF